MGVVYKALDPAIGRTVAIKAIRLKDLTNPEERQRLRERLLREAQSAGVLSHPNIITIYDVLEAEDVAYIFMEYVPGPSLEQMLHKRSLPDAPSLLNFLRQVGTALDYAHRKGIVHRDIKPGNIIISDVAPGAEQLAKIADFGVAKFVSHEMTHSGTMIGTPNYMSPEQIQGTTIDGHSDQFSLRVVVYELLTGNKPFIGDSLPALFYSICKQDPEPVNRVNPTLTETVAKVLQRALAKDPSQRFPSCGDFIGALTIALGDSPDWTPASQSSLAPNPAALDATAAGIARDNAPPPEAPPRAEQTATAEFTTPPTVISIPAAPQEITHDAPATRLRRRSEEEDEEPAERTSRSKHLGLIVAMCLAIAGAIVFIVRSNSGPPIPVQVIDTRTAPATPPPEDLNAGKRAPAHANTHQAAVTRPEPRQLTPSREEHTSIAPLGASDVELLTDPPGAKVVVDGNSASTCTAPCTLSLRSGRHTLTAELDGYTIARRIFNVPDDSSLYIPLGKSTGVVLVTSSPSGCPVTVDGRSSGQTPTTLHLTAGTHRIAVGGHEETIQVQTEGFDARRFPCQ